MFCSRLSPDECCAHLHFSVLRLATPRFATPRGRRSPQHKLLSRSLKRTASSLLRPLAPKPMDAASDDAASIERANRKAASRAARRSARSAADAEEGAEQSSRRRARASAAAASSVRGFHIPAPPAHHHHHAHAPLFSHPPHPPMALNRCRPWAAGISRPPLEATLRVQRAAAPRVRRVVATRS